MNIYLGADTLLYFDEFHNTRTGAVIESGTVAALLYDINEDPPTQVGDPITLQAVGDGTGDWYGTIADTHAGLKLGMRVRVQLSADGGNGLMCLKKPVMTVVDAQ